MPKITYVHPDGKQDTLEVAAGITVMQGATARGIDGIVAQCGGNAMCATCHVFVAPDQLHLLPEMSGDEDALLDGTATDRQPNSRLSCQILVTPKLDGLVVHLPERQV